MVCDVEVIEDVVLLVLAIAASTDDIDVHWSFLEGRIYFHHLSNLHVSSLEVDRTLASLASLRWCFPFKPSSLSHCFDDGDGAQYLFCTVLVSFRQASDMLLILHCFLQQPAQKTFCSQMRAKRQLFSSEPRNDWQ
jgi:hypothetical protein